MDEYVISFINDNDVNQEITFRGVTQKVATALAVGLTTAGYSLVTLTGTRRKSITLPDNTNTEEGS